MYEADVRRDLLRAIVVAALVGTVGGTVITLVGMAILKSALLSLVILPLALALAVMLAVLPSALFLCVAAVAPRFVVRHRGAWACGIPVLVVLASTWGSENRLFPFDLPYGSACAITGAIIGCWWCYHFTSHLTDQV